MLDVHVLVMDYTPKEWVEQCRESIDLSAANAGFPVAVHFLPGIVGHLGRARAAGYALGVHPYVTHVDDDDYVRPDAFSVLREHLEAGTVAITTGETQLFESGTERDEPNARHHLAIYRRDVLERFTYSAFRHFPDQYLLSRTKAIHVPECVYAHRVRQGSGSRKMRAQDRAGADAELRAVGDRSLSIVEGMTPAEIAARQDAILSEAQ